MNYLDEIIKQVKPRSPRPYKGGIELRGIDLDGTKHEIENLIKENNWPVEIFEVDVRLKSISIRLVA